MTGAGRWIIGAWLAFAAACVVTISRTDFNTDMSAFLPRTPTPQQKILVEQLREGVVSRLILVGLNGAEPPELARISKSMAAQLRQDSQLASVNNGERAAQQRDFEFLWQNRYLLSPAVTKEHFSAAGLRDSLLSYVDLLGSPMGALAQRVLPADPSGELLALLDQIEGQAKPEMREGVWFSKDGQRAVLLVQTKAMGSDLDAQERAMNAIRTAFDAAVKAAANPAGVTQLHMTGPGVFSVQSRENIRGDATLFSLIATVLISAMLLLIYRSPRALVLGLLPVASGALAGVAAVSVGFGSVHGITLGFGVTLIGEGVDYAIYLFTQIAPGETPKTTLQRIWPTLRLGVFTSICGFSAMLFSGFTGLAQLGLFSIAGLIVAVTVTRWVLPELLPAGFFVKSAPRLSGKLMALVHLAPRARAALIFGVVGLFLLLVLQRDALWNDNLASISPVPKAEQVVDEQLRRDMGAPDVRYMLVASAGDQEAALELSEALSAKLRDLVQRQVLAGFEAPSEALPSRHAQAARQAALPDGGQLRANLSQALYGLPFRSGLFAPFLQDVAAAKQQALIQRADLQGSSMELKLNSLLLKREAGWAAMLPLRGVANVDALSNELQLGAGSPVVLLDMKQESERMFRDYRHEATTHALLGAAAIVLLLLFSLRSLRRVIDVVLPLIAAVLVVTAGLVWSGHPLTIFHLIGLLLVVAVGSNYSLFFDRQEASDQGRERTIASLLFANISTVIGFGLLSFSRAPVLNALGSTVALGAVLSLVFSAIWIGVGRQRR
jgi:predicted exporter